MKSSSYIFLSTIVHTYSKVSSVFRLEISYLVCQIDITLQIAGCAIVFIILRCSDQSRPFSPPILVVNIISRVGNYFSWGAKWETQIVIGCQTN